MKYLNLAIYMKVKRRRIPYSLKMKYLNLSIYMKVTKSIILYGLKMLTHKII